MKYEILPLRAAFYYIIIFTLCVSGSAALGLWVYKKMQQTAAGDERYQIGALWQDTKETEPLSNTYLAELLGLSVDRPVSLRHYSTEEGLKALFQCPVIKKAGIKKNAPGALLIEYSLRKPMAYLAEYSNTCLDAEGVAIPCRPFFTPQHWPEFFLGDVKEPLCLGSPIQSEALSVALSIQAWFSGSSSKDSPTLKRVDVSRIDAPSAGQREIIVTVEEILSKMGPVAIYLRLGIENFEQDLQNYWSLREHIAKNKSNHLNVPTIVDLRVRDVAFLAPVL